MKKFILVSSIIVFILTGIITVAGANPIKPDKNVICHATGNHLTPYTRIVVSWNAISGHFENNGTPKAGHEDDLMFEGEDALCPSCTVDCGGGGGGGCTLPENITGFNVQNATLNDNKLELVWATTTAPTVNIRYGYEDNNWLFSKNGTPNDGFEVISGLTNGIHYWFSVQAVNGCGSGNWAPSVDPLP